MGSQCRYEKSNTRNKYNCLNPNSCYCHPTIPSIIYDMPGRVIRQIVLRVLFKGIKHVLNAYRTSRYSRKYVLVCFSKSLHAVRCAQMTRAKITRAVSGFRSDTSRRGLRSFRPPFSVFPLKYCSRYRSKLLSCYLALRDHPYSIVR